jgi:hypothetical protein
VGITLQRQWGGATTANHSYCTDTTTGRRHTAMRGGTPMLICLLSSPPPPILHFHTPAIVGNDTGTCNGHSPLHSIVYSSSSIRVRLSAVPLRGPPSAVARRPPCLALYVLLYYAPNSYMHMLRCALTVLCPRARRAGLRYGYCSIRMGITGTYCDLSNSNICPRRKWGNYS